MGTDAHCSLGIAILACLIAPGGSGPPTLVGTEPWLPHWLCGGRGLELTFTQGSWQGQLQQEEPGPWLPGSKEEGKRRFGPSCLL